MYLHDDLNVLAQAVRLTSRALNLNESFILKDYFAVMVLREITDRNADLVFKGGTCLSKCYGAIDRFSEDVDLGIPYEHATESMRKRIKHSVVESVAALNLQISNLESTRSRREYNRYDVLLPGTADMLILETAVMTPSSPFVERSLQSFIGQLAEEQGRSDFVAEYRLESFSIRANSLERTFVDKIFAICDYYLSGSIPPRQSRHIYDLYKLVSLVDLNDELIRLVATVRRQRKGNFRCYSADDMVDLATTLETIESRDSYKKDYTTITMPLLYEPILYEDAIESLRIIAGFLREQ